MEYNYLIGKKVRKRSNKPFSNGEKVLTVLAIVINPYSGKVACLLEDSSIVDCYILIECEM